MRRGRGSCFDSDGLLDLFSFCSHMNTMRIAPDSCMVTGKAGGKGEEKKKNEKKGKRPSEKKA